MSPAAFTIHQLGEGHHKYIYVEVPLTGTLVRICRKCKGSGTCDRCNQSRTDPESPIFASVKEATLDATQRGRARAKRANRRRTNPVPTQGRTKLVGTVRRVEKRYSERYGTRYEIDLETEVGYRFRGTCPQSIAPHWVWDDDRMDYVVAGVHIGCRVELYGTVHSYPNGINYFNRPTNARILEEEPNE